jgi:hypothetical protein
MADVTPIANEAMFAGMRAAIRTGGGGWREKTKLFVKYLLDQDALYCVVPDHPAYTSQRELAAKLSQIMRGRRTTHTGTPARASRS